MKFWNKMKKNSKGFTLVEIIVVLVILAVLAAFTIPSMLGFVGEARGKAMIAEAREVYVAAQASATELSANGTSITPASFGSTNTVTLMTNYLGSDIDANATWSVTLENDGTVAAPDYTGEVTSITYERNGYRVTINPTSASISGFEADGTTALTIPAGTTVTEI